eukprot:scaffold3077_cov162-Amphora_coffeaeformis.AAC.40
MSAPTMTKAPPTANGGTLARIGAKKMDKKKKKATKMAVRPVRAPASTPAPLSMYEVTGDVPKMAPNIVARASEAYASRALGKSPFSSTNPIADTIPRRVPCGKDVL